MTHLYADAILSFSVLCALALWTALHLVEEFAKALAAPSTARRVGGLALTVGWAYCWWLVFSLAFRAFAAPVPR